MQDLPNEVVVQILDYCKLHELRTVLHRVCLQWFQSSKQLYFSRQSHCTLIGPYVLFNNNKKQQQLKLLQCDKKGYYWTSGSTLLLFHSYYLFHDSCYYYYYTKRNDELWMICRDIETEGFVWKKRVAGYMEGTSVTHDSEFICVQTRSHLCILSKSVNHTQTYYYELSAGLQYVLFTPNFIVVEERNILIFRKPQQQPKLVNYKGRNKRSSLQSQEFVQLEPHCEIPVNRSLNSSSICFSSVYNEYVTKRECSDRVYVDCRPKGHTSIILQCYDCETGQQIYSKNVGSFNYVDLTMASSDYWCLTGGSTFDNARNTYLMHFETGNLLTVGTNHCDQSFAFNIVSKVFHSAHDLISTPQGNQTVGLCAFNDKCNSCTFYELFTQMGESEQVVLKQKWTIPTDDIFQFKYKPTIQLLCIDQSLYLLAFGGPGCILYCINIDNGSIHWKRALLTNVLNADHYYSHFDVHIKMVALDVSQEQVCISGCIKHCAFFSFLANRKMGVTNETFTPWIEHEHQIIQDTKEDQDIDAHDDYEQKSGNHSKCQIC